MPLKKTSLPERPELTLAGPERISRRQFVARNLRLLALVAAGEGLTETSHIETTRHRVPMPGLREPMRVVQLTDLHRSWCVSEGYIEKVVAQANALRPDLCALTGDFVTRKSDYAYSCARHLANLRAPLGVYGVPGNHDYWADNGRGLPMVARMLAAARVQLVINRNLRLPNGVRLVGLDDLMGGWPKPEVAFSGYPWRGEPILTLLHNPALLQNHQVAAKQGVVLAGHTHGGQISIPYITASVLRRTMPFLHGWHRLPGSPARLYVSRGLGVVGIPARFRARPEIAVFDFLPA